MGRKKRNLIDSIIFHITKKPSGYKKVKNPPKTALQKLTRPKVARQVQYNTWYKSKTKKSESSSKRKRSPTYTKKNSGRFFKNISLFSWLFNFKRKTHRNNKIIVKKKKKENNLVKILKQRNEKFNQNDILFITKDKTDQIVWLEKGNKSAGFEHIKARHASDFEAKHKIPVDELAEYLSNIFSRGEIQYSRIIHHNKIEGFEKLYKYKGKYYILSGVGTNGFIVSAYPLGDKEAEAHIRRYKNEK